MRVRGETERRREKERDREERRKEGGRDGERDCSSEDCAELKVLTLVVHMAKQHNVQVSYFASSKHLFSNDRG